MAVVSAPLSHVGGMVVAPPTIAEPAYRGLWSWFTTVDHKRIGILYGVSAGTFFVIGGLEALVIRLQLWVPGNTLVTAQMFNALFTMHATTMIFLAIMPMGAAFFNFILPLQIGARDVAFPRLNAFSYWAFILGGIMLNISFLLGGAPDAGWFGYANLTTRQYSPGPGIDFWMLGLQVLGVASIAAALNFFVTILNMRAPGMGFMRMPIFTWMSLITMVLLLLAFPSITVGLILLMFDRFFDTNFYSVPHGGDPILWQHLFWVFGHPEVYILILPGMGIVSEIIPVFSRKPLFGYAVMVYSGIAIGFLAFGVWAHHMFAVGLGAISDAVFASSTMLIAVPTGVKIFNWIGTMFKGSVNFKTPMLWAIGFISMFIIGGLSGIMHASPPADLIQHDTYFIVAHIHYVLIGGSIMALMAGIYYWFPKMSGRMMNEKLGKWNFWTFVIFFNLTFMPMHWTGLLGMPRRVYTYGIELGVTELNQVSTIGAIGLGFSVLLFVINLFTSLRYGEVAGDDPWDGATLEWSIPSPPPVYNFARIPTVYSRDAWWAMKHPERMHLDPIEVTPLAGGPAHGAQLAHDVVAVAAPEAPPPVIHMPSPSYWPLLAAVGLATMAVGLLASESFGPVTIPIFAIAGLMLLIGSIYGWSYEAAEMAHAPVVVDVSAAPVPEAVGASPPPLVLEHPHTSTGLDSRKLLMWAFLASDCMFFGTLIATYMVYKNRSLDGPMPRETFDVPYTSVSAFVLLLSSLTMVLALAAIQHGQERRMRVWLSATALLGCVFLGGQFYEFTTFYRDGLTLSRNLFGSTFFTLTGFHGTHVFIGVFWLLSLVAQSVRGRLHQEHSLWVEIAGLYWHFVDIVWILIFTLVYLIPD